MGANQPSMSISGTTVTICDSEGQTYTATGITAEHGDAIGMEIRADGRWLTVGTGPDMKRFPLRHGNDPHYTELTTFRCPPNPLFDRAGE